MNLPDWLRRMTSRLARRRRGEQPLDSDPSADRPTVAFCPFCGAVLDPSFETGSDCPQCDERITWDVTVASLSEEGASQANADMTPTRELQSEALGEAILSYSRRGYYVVRQKNDFAEMRKPTKKINAAIAGALAVAGGPLPGGFFLYPAAYVAWHALQNEQCALIFVEKDGSTRIE